MKRNVLYFLILIGVCINGFSAFINPVEGSRELVSVFGGARMTSDLNSLEYSLGLGISTGEKTGIPVRCMAAGYVEKVIRNHPVYGTGIFINHGDGIQSRYTNLFKLKGDFMKIFDAINIEFESGYLELQFEPREFEVKEGEIIGYSGVSGRSGVPYSHVEIVDLNRDMSLNPVKYIDMTLKDSGYTISFKKIRINMEEYDFREGIQYPYTGKRPSVDILIENGSEKEEFKFAVQKIEVRFDDEEVLIIDMDEIPLDQLDTAMRVYGEGTNHQTFWYRLTTPWMSKPIVMNEIRNMDVFSDKIKVDITVTDVFGTVENTVFWLKRR
ncbi:MAG TPA: M23 family metallopeptidase [Thermotogota bacterium]|nr:M23 family metallopeptidase [Thermotogota bacterium]HPJ88784.1 M23 family metallopeptidase [Thermotogota bacterium]HPR96287.1 M23 family metallopeptidase [Thermotogota bacterium]